MCAAHLSVPLLDQVPQIGALKLSNVPRARYRVGITDPMLTCTLPPQVLIGNRACPIPVNPAPWSSGKRHGRSCDTTPAGLGSKPRCSPIPHAHTLTKHPPIFLVTLETMAEVLYWGPLQVYLPSCAATYPARSSILGCTSSNLALSCLPHAKRYQSWNISFDHRFRTQLSVQTLN